MTTRRPYRARHTGLIAAVMLTSATMTACGGSAATDTGAAAHGFPLTISSCGKDVTFTTPPKRAVTVGSIAAPLIAAAGAADRVVTRTFETAPFPGQYADALRNAEIIAPTAELAREEIISRTPDVVVSFEGAAVKPEDLAAANIPLLITRGYCKDAAGTFDDVFADIELYGKLFGTEQVAKDNAAALRSRVTAVTDRHPAGARQRPAAALILSRDGSTLNAYGSTSTVHHQMRLLGLDNVFGDVAKRSFQANTETLIARNPEVIILLTQGDQTPESARAALRARAELGSVQAISADRLIVVPFGYTGPGPVAVEGLEVLDSKLGALG
ncbi:ABC transporter substrate-binding protein [Nocardia huaxiensis]|uniref:ABC transporter substrate-binding protein n=1 Tax=Nocardia huaxiensis TaxID=2755382 RepID=A0A7D6Z156_9NOCA|nr:ABC transporter substrate-binding protein [Nocardia huaxiensis]QLY27904.1 ABC transporter substrate-binding protein [Nocardia huaxiensis]UFS98692.1 ABC transporter substrate-binding protein [Nocardia huaxiensis]